MIYGCDEDYTTRQFNAHNTETRTVCYPWQTWYGHAVIIHAALAKRDQAIFHCQLEHNTRIWSLEIPQWMFDPVICTTMRRQEMPVVNGKALLNLKALLAYATVSGDSVVVQSQSHSMSTRGETDATDPRSSTEGSTRHISSTPSRDRLANATGTNKTPNRGITGTTVSRASTASIQCHREKQGAKG